MVQKFYSNLFWHMFRSCSLLLLVFIMAACTEDNTEPAKPNAGSELKGFSLTTESVLAEPETESIEIAVTADDDLTWSVDEPFNEWLTASQSTKKGNGTITLNIDTNTDYLSRQGYVLVRCNGNKFYIDVNQKEGINVAPEKPEYLQPASEATQVNPYMVFKWMTATDLNNDKLKYTISYSKDQTNWITSTPTDKLIYNEELNTFDRLSHYVTLADKFEVNTPYYWYVTVIDGRGLETKGDIQMFTTGDPKMSADGSWTYYDEDSKAGVIPLIFTGDGFIPSDYVEGGDFDKKIDEGIEYFFNIEPYKSFRKQFKIIKLVAYSQEQGITINDPDANYPHYVDVNTRFKVTYTGNGYNGTGMNIKDYGATAFKLARESIPELFKTPSGNDVFNNTTLIVVANYWLYGGTCWWPYTDNEDPDPNDRTTAKTVGIIPACEEGRVIPWMDPKWAPTVPFSYEATMHHEAGGHGFGRLADEYWGNSSSDIRDLVEHGFHGNVDNTDDKGQVKWKYFFDVSEKYPKVGIYPCMQFSAGGVYMSEEANYSDRTSGSCMNNMYNPFSAVSREFIMQKIYKATGTPYSFNEFLAKDKEDVAPTKARASMRLPMMRDMPHTSPQVVK